MEGIGGRRDFSTALALAAGVPTTKSVWAQSMSKRLRVPATVLLGNIPGILPRPPACLPAWEPDQQWEPQKG